MPLLLRHLSSVEQLTPEIVLEIFRVTREMERLLSEKGRSPLLQDKMIALLFFEASTRTSLSFQAAASRLGAGIVIALGKDTTSLKKGESIEDTIRMAGGYADLIVMRHPEEGSAARAAAVSPVPFINAGDGGNEHPTQALLDLYTIQKSMGRLHGLHVSFASDPLHSRTIRSLALLLSLYPGNRFTFASPPSLRMGEALRKKLKGRGVALTEVERLEDAVAADVLYMNRLQQERFSDHHEFEQLRHQFVLTSDILKGRATLVMDPLPRVDEVAPDVDTLPNALYWQQARNGVPVRMALLAMMLGKA